MTGIMRFTPEAVAPPQAAALQLQGVAAGRRVSDAIETIWREARALFDQVADPVGMLAEIPQAEFARVFEGQGRNEARTPVADIAPRAARRALFAATLGPETGREIAARFESNDFALGCMLDSIASLAADALAERVAEEYRRNLETGGAIGAEARALCYSPGYCGWHISGQKELFEYLGPHEIGIALGASFLMYPLKSVTGVVLVGPRKIHEFPPDYECCAGCRTRTCRTRINALKGE
jgi:hypothetical protein